jgi:hypothetical protein
MPSRLGHTEPCTAGPLEGPRPGLHRSSERARCSHRPLLDGSSERARHCPGRRGALFPSFFLYLFLLNKYCLIFINSYN